MFSIFSKKSSFDNQFRLYNYQGEVVFQKNIDENKILNRKFYFMDFIKEGLKESKEFLPNIDITKTIKEINDKKMNGKCIFNIKSIMVLDDEQSLLDCYKMYLTRLNHYVETYKESESAEKILQKDNQRFDSILTDNTMPPGLTGAELAKKIYNLYNKEISIYIITGNTYDVDRNIFDEANVQGTIAKPVNKHTFSMSIGSGYNKNILEFNEKLAA